METEVDVKRIKESFKGFREYMMNENTNAITDYNNLGGRDGTES